MMNLSLRHASYPAEAAERHCASALQLSFTAAPALILEVMQ
jgi:hypothetical protein